MRIVLNGEPREVPEGVTVAELVREETPGSPAGRGMAVALDAEVLPRAAWEKTRVAEGQRVEVLAAIQGG